MKKIMCALLASACLLGFTACESSDLDTDVGAAGSPDGKWEVVGFVDADGMTTLAKDEEGWYECFDISGDSGKYTVRTDDFDKTYDITLEKLDGDKYDIKMRGMLSIGTAEFGSKKMAYEVGEDSQKYTYVYEKK